MKPLRTVLWLEFRKHKLFSLLLVGWIVLALGAVYQVTIHWSVADNFGTSAFAAAAGRYGTLLSAAILFIAPAFLGLAYLCHSLSSETKAGQFPLLLTTQTSGHTHVVGRFLFAFAHSLLLTVVIGEGAWLAGGALGDWREPNMYFGLVIALYSCLLLGSPALAWLLFIDVVASSYRLRGSSTVATVVFFFATPGVAAMIYSWMKRVSYEWTAGIPVPRLEGERGVAESVNGLPWEPLGISLLVTLVCLGLAGRIWNEVEL